MVYSIIIYDSFQIEVFVSQGTETMKIGSAKIPLKDIIQKSSNYIFEGDLAAVINSVCIIQGE